MASFSNANEEWENPSYFVKDLDNGRSYHVEEIDQHYSLITLDSFAQLSTKYALLSFVLAFFSLLVECSSDSTVVSPTLLSLYPIDELNDIEISDTGIKENNEVALEPLTENCLYNGCDALQNRTSGYCVQHESKAREDEDSRAQALYLIPLGCRATFIRSSGHGFVRDSTYKLYTVYILEIRCDNSNANWIVYRRYQEFKTLNDQLRLLGYRVPLLPPKKLIGSFDPEFLSRRQAELSHWLRCLLEDDESDPSWKSPHENEDVRRFLTSKADQPPFPMETAGEDEIIFDEQGESPEKELDLEDNSCNDSPTKKAEKVGLHNFEMIQVIGKGSFGKVILVGHKSTKDLYAMKVLSKSNIVRRKQVEHTRTERRVLEYTKHPFIVGLHYAFQTPERLYFVLDYCPGGELFYHLTRMKKLPEHMACFYAAEITLALEHLHSLGVVYRDLKPENILLDAEGHIKLADFGLAKEGITTGTKGTNSLCGTPEYLPPEILDRQGHGTAVDWWNLGMVIYEMLTGLPPWYTNDRQKLFDRLRAADLIFPPYISPNAEALIRALLNRNPERRLGSAGAQDVKKHVFFGMINWKKLLNRQVKPPFTPCRFPSKGQDPVNFEVEFTRLPLPSMEASRDRLESDTFQGFTYANPSDLGVRRP